VNEVEKSGKEQWVKDKDAEWYLEVPSWERPRWFSALQMLGEKPLSEGEKLRLKALRLGLEQKGRLSGSQLARLRVLAEKHGASIPTVPALPVALGSSGEEAEEVTKEEKREQEEEEPNKEELWKEFASILSKEGKMNPDEWRSAFEEEWNLSLKELPPEQAQRVAVLFAREVITKGVPLPPKLRPPPVAVSVQAGPLDLLVRDFLEGKIDYETYHRRARELQESRRIGSA